MGTWIVALTLSASAQSLGFELQAVGSATGTPGLARVELSVQNPTRRPRQLTIVTGTPFAPVSGVGATVFLAEPVDVTVPAGATQKLSVAAIANSDDGVAGAYEPTGAKELTGRFLLIHQEASGGPSQWPLLAAALRPPTTAPSSEGQRLRARLLELDKVPTAQPAQTAALPLQPPPPPPPSDRITGGTILSSGALLESPNRQYRLACQADGNCVVYRVSAGTAQPIWATQTRGVGCRLLVEPTGKLRVVDSAGKALWQGGQDGPAGELQLQLQDDGNLVLYRRSGDRWIPLWSSQG